MYFLVIFTYDKLNDANWMKRKPKKNTHHLALVVLCLNNVGKCNRWFFRGAARRGVKVRNSYNFANRWQNAGEKIRYYILVLLIHCYCFGFCSLQRFICFSIYYCSTKCIHCSCQSPSRFLSHMSNMFQPSLVQAHPFKIESIVQRSNSFFLKPNFSQLTW